MRVIKRKDKEHYPTYSLTELTLGQVLAIYSGLVQHNTILAREMVVYLRTYCPEELAMIHKGY